MRDFYFVFLVVSLTCSIWYNVYQYRIIHTPFEKCGTSTIFDEVKINSMIQSLEEGSDDEGA